MKVNKLAGIGFLVFTCFVVFFIGIKFLQEESFQKSTFTFKVVFSDIQGLDISDDVKMLGKKIGRISGTEIIGQKIAVQLTIDNSFSFKIPIDSDIEITQSDLMGSKYLAIYPGKDSENFILPGDTVSGSSIEVGSLTEDVGNFARKLNETYGQKQKEQIKSTISNIESSSMLLEEFILSNKDLITEEDKDNLHNLLSNINNISDNLAALIGDESENIKKSIGQFNKAMEDLPVISQELSEALLSLKNIVAKIDSGEGTLSKLIHDNEIYENVNGLVLDARSLLGDVKDNPTKYLRAWFEAKKKN